ncbi:MAG: ATP-binding protein [Bacteroidales bacterium]|nr:ATP-binding protein [Bacteroidales bacterium]
MLYERKLYKSIKLFFQTRDIIVIHGARQTGKTTLLQIIQQDLPTDATFYFDLEDSRYKELCEGGIFSVIAYLKQKGIYKQQQKFYLLIDEIQYLSNPSSFLKFAHDHFPFIKLIVSGSSSFEIKSKFKDTLVGRTVNFELFPLDFEEFLWFKNKQYNIGEKSTNNLINHELKHLYKEYVIYGGYPKIVLTDKTEIKEKYLQQIIDTYIKGDIRDIARIRHIEKFNKLLQILANQSGQLINVVEIANTAKISRQTVEDYLFILQNTYIIKLIPPYSKNIRSELFKTPKVFFFDTGLMNMLGKKYLPHEISGILFETAVFSDLVKNIGLQNINYWRTMDKKEIDFIILKKQHTIPIEVKLNARNFNLTPIKFFSDKYKISNRYCVSLEGELPEKTFKVNQIFPWELYKSLI